MNIKELINSEEFRQELLEAINSGKDEDWVIDLEYNEHSIDTFDEDISANSIIKLLNDKLT